MDHNHLLEVLTREGVLINVSVRYWRASKKLRPEDLGLKLDPAAESLISLGHKKLLPKDALQPFALIESRAHSLVEASTFPFLHGLGHFLPNTKLSEVTDRLEELGQEFRQQASSFQDRYEQAREQGLREWARAARSLSTDPAPLLAAIRAAFPRPDQVARRFDFATHLFQIQLPEELDLKLTTVTEQQEIAEARRRAAREAATRITQGVEEFISDCAASMRSQTAQLCEEMLQSMRNGKTGVHQKTLNRLVHFIDQFRQLNFVGDREMEGHLELVRRELLTRTAEEYRDSGAAKARLQNGLRALADTARELARQDSHDLVEHFGQMGRRKFHMVA